ncbi:MAG: energy transducer TonB [Terracidiphilus sp.]|jgi:TonB family protein
MRKTRFLLILLILAAGTAWAQQELAPSTDDGPLTVKPVPVEPDKDGVYTAGPGIVSPSVLKQASAAYPADASAEAVNGICILSLVVGADGVPTNIEVVTTHGAAFDAAAINAIKQSTFEPGTFDGKPVPVRIYARTRFFGDRRPAVTRIMEFNIPGGGFSHSLRGADWPPHSIPPRNYDQPPFVIHWASPEFSDQARREKFQGVVLVSVLINEEGMPADPRVERSIGHGLDENALKSILQCRFKPAMKDGKPVATRIMMEVSFRLNN